MDAGGAMDRNFINDIAKLAQRALLYEATLFPKPGLVDPISCGAHRDMDIYTFIDSSVALGDAFSDFVKIGADYANEEPKFVQKLLRERGISAEAEMFRATNHINTHKGIIYSMAFCLCAAGRIFANEKFADKKTTGNGLIVELLEEVRALSSGILAFDMEKAIHKKERTMGERLYLEHGIGGVRGEVEAGLPTAKMAYDFLISTSLSQESLLTALLKIMATNCDTNVISRGGFGLLDELKKRSKRILESERDNLQNALSEMDKWCIKQNISSGGSADLLSIAIFLYLLNQVGEKRWKN